MKGFLIPSVTHSFLQGFQKSHNPVPSPGSESEGLLFIVFGAGVPAAVLVAAPAPLADPLGRGSGDWDLPTSRTLVFGVMVAEGRGTLFPLPEVSSWSLLMATLC